jgi:hypothetical protein
MSPFERPAAFASSKSPCLTIDGTGDSRGTSAMIRIATFYYAVSSIFSFKYSRFWPNKVHAEFFAKTMGNWPPFCLFCHFLVSKWMLKSSVFAK